MQRIRNWLLPALVALPNGVLAVLVLLPGGASTGPLLPAGLLTAFVLQVAALGQRHRAPLWALAGTLAALLAGRLTAPEHFVNLSAPVAMYCVALRCGGRVTALATAVAVGCAWLPEVLDGGSPAALLTDLGFTASLYMACAGLGEARRQWRDRRWAAAGRLATADGERRRAGHTERNRLARELHDVSAHHLTSVVVTVDAARRLGGSRPELLAEALAFAVRAGEETVTALRRLMAVMRDTEPADPRPMSGHLHELVAGFSRLGRPIDAEIPDDLAGPAAEAAFGITREALTNALRHAPGAPVRVRIRRTDGALSLTVDNGAPRAAADRARATAGLGSGNGLTGMRERAAAVGGELHAAPHGDDGWRVAATLPDSTGPLPQQGPARRRDLLREQRLTDASLVFLAVVVPLFLVLSTVADGVQPGSASGMAVLALLLSAHAGPLLWRRRSAWGALWGVAATAWLVPAACAADLMPAGWTGLLPGAVTAEAMAVYAVATYGRGAVRSLGAVIAATVNLVAAMTVTAAVDGVLALPPGEPGAVMRTAFLLTCVLGPLLLALWGTGLGVRRRRLRVVTREENAVTDTERQAAAEAAAERHRMAVELHATVLDRTTRMVCQAEQGGLDEVASEARAALASMRELLRGLRGAADNAERHAPQPAAEDLTELCRVLRSAGRDVTLRGLPRAAEGLPAPVSLTAYRFVETALGAGDRGPGRVTLLRRRGQVHITVTGVPLAVAGPVAERLRIQAESAEGKMTVDAAGTLRVSLPAGNTSAPVEEVPTSPYA
ncbi:histidine kinase [Streptomyces sp. NPDC094143]|uniref:sensor histidine kinase n=1 Tax=Streptomyces sp. NPDC094143 TaxID=3155310 RepID=UPI003324D199